MGIPRWAPKTTISTQEGVLLARLRRTKKLFGFLREHRDRIFDDAFQEELEAMYRKGAGGKPPVAPALMAMATLLQGYVGASDAEVVELTVVDLRWQMVLDRLGAKAPAFSQGAFHDFRHRFIRHDMDRRLLERTAEVARETAGFDPKKLPKTLRVAMDSMPLDGAGRVEDTINLLAHAARQVLTCAASLLSRQNQELAREMKTSLFITSSVKRALDIDWTDSAAKKAAVQKLVAEIDRIEAWIAKYMVEQSKEPPLQEHLATLKQLREQDLEPDPSGGSRIRDGVALDRRISVKDKHMRHGRKSKSKRIDGFKRHIAVDVDTELILACALTPANRPEFEAAHDLHEDTKHASSRSIGELLIDRGYLNAPLVEATRREGAEVVCKPWRVANGSLFAKTDFRFDFRRQTVTCPAGNRQSFELGAVLEFSPAACAGCSFRTRCLKNPESTRGRLMQIAADEPHQHLLRKQVATKAGRAKLRERTIVEHRLSHLAAKQGRRARYIGLRSNLFDTRRAAAVLNLEVCHRHASAQAA
jgi:hypothetical protein